ncbi:MAG: superoxide dismutase, Ni [Acidimicrobiia bacterium]|nr:superoxide dismutase, Ni [Acidimicrobiia bacterium]NNC74494.1 superoxide dismutase, Ni [Acidimicrobiia bacterium]
MRLRHLMKPRRTVHAHCHVPCGIYDPVFAQNAAETVEKMVTQLLELDAPGADASSAEKVAFHQSVTRRVENKEEHAKKVKYELLDVLWTQYFKPAHVERWPDLHDKFFNAGHLATQNMQEISAEKAKALRDAVDEIAAIFHESKS